MLMLHIEEKNMQQKGESRRRRTWLADKTIHKPSWTDMRRQKEELNEGRDVQEHDTVYIQKQITHDDVDDFLPRDAMLAWYMP